MNYKILLSEGNSISSYIYIFYNFEIYTQVLKNCELYIKEKNTLIQKMRRRKLFYKAIVNKSILKCNLFIKWSHTHFHKMYAFNKIPCRIFFSSKVTPILILKYLLNLNKALMNTKSINLAPFKDVKFHSFVLRNFKLMAT